MYDSAGNVIAENDDSDFSGPGDTSEWTLNSFLAYSFDAPGTYIVGVGAAFPDFVTWETLQVPVFPETSYTLHVSIQGHAVAGGDIGPEPVPEPSTVLMLGLGVLGVIGLGRKKLAKK